MEFMVSFGANPII